MFKSSGIYIFLLGGLFIVSACNKSPEDAYKATIVFKSTIGEPVAKVGDMPLTQGYLEKRITPRWAPRVTANIESKKEFVQGQINEEILMQEAIRRGYLNNPDVQQLIKGILVKRITKEEAMKLDNNVKITEEELKAYYQSHYDDYNKPAKIKSAHIYIPFAPDQKAALKKANEAYKKALAKAGDKFYFESLVKEYTPALLAVAPQVSIYRTKEEAIKDVGEKPAEALWAMDEKTEVSAPIADKNGYYIFYKQTKHSELAQTLEEVKTMIENKVSQEKRKAAFLRLVDDLKKNYSVKIYEDRVSKLELSPKADEYKYPWLN